MHLKVEFTVEFSFTVCRILLFKITYERAYESVDDGSLSILGYIFRERWNK